MKKRKPVTVMQQIHGNVAELTLKIDAAIVDFQGHFSSFPLLPGVTQVDWAVYYGKEVLHTYSEFRGMEAIKFQEPIFPESTVVLRLVWQPERGVLQFCYFSVIEGQDERLTHSSGRIKLVKE